MDACDLRSESSLSCISSSSPISSPDMSSCHRCGLRFPISDTIDQFRTLNSQWRIVLLCYDCLDGVKSAKVCSYCFLEISELGKGILGCIACSCRVHRACVRLHHRNLWTSQLDADRFFCVDCCPVHIFRGKDPNKFGSRAGFRFLLADLVRDGKSMSEKVVITEGKVRKNRTNRALVVRIPTEVAKTALGAVHSVKQHTQNNIIPDQELALRLHRSINGSQRISRTFGLIDETRLNVLRRVRDSSCSVGRLLDSNSDGHHVKIEGYSENKSLLEDRETSPSIRTDSLLETENEDQLNQLREYKTEGLDGFALKEKDILYVSSETTSDCSNVSSASLPMNCLLNNTMHLTKFRFGEGSSELQRKAIDARGPDMCIKKYFRRQWRSRRFLVDS